MYTCDTKHTGKVAKNQVKLIQTVQPQKATNFHRIRENNLINPLIHQNLTPVRRTRQAVKSEKRTGLVAT